MTDFATRQKLYGDGKCPYCAARLFVRVWSDDTSQEVCPNQPECIFRGGEKTINDLCREAAANENPRRV